MPEVSRFYGIVIRMFFREHGPPHFHADYGGQQAVVGIEDLAVLRGRLPPRALGFVVENSVAGTRLIAILSLSAPAPT